MAKQLFGNNASALLAASISESDLTIQVANGFGALFPNPGVDEYFLVTLENDNGDIEIVKVTARSVDLFTVPVGGRGQEGTSAQAWTNGQTRVELRLTRGTMETFIQRGGDVMSGDLDMNGNDLIDAKLTGASTQLLAGEIVNVPLRGVAGDSSNEIRVPIDGTRATAGGARILVQGGTQDVRNTAFVIGQILLWYGNIGSIPQGWALCDGSNGTPDLRDRFVVGAGSTYALGATGGSVTASGVTSLSGAHDHGGVTGSTALTIAQMPSHQHHVIRDAIVHSDVWTNNDAAVANESTAGGDTEYDLAPTTFGTWQGYSEATGGGEGHTHSIASVAGHSHSLSSISILPPYMGLYYIMYVGI